MQISGRVEARKSSDNPEQDAAMASEKFRQQLRQEAEQWRSEGLINADQFQQLADRYQFEGLDRIARDRFVVVVLCLGCALLGLSVITFVAANWQAIGRGVKLLLLMALFLGVSTIGFYLWHLVPQASLQKNWQHRFGLGLLLLGALILGANLALVGQMFHSTGTFAELCLVWGLAVLAMAYALRLTLLGVLAILLMGIGYWSGVSYLVGLGTLPGIMLLIRNMPIAATLLFLPLAYWCRSRTIFVLGSIAVISSFEVVLQSFGLGLNFASGFLAAIAFTIPPALLWSFEDEGQAVHQNEEHQTEKTATFAPLARSLAIIFLVGLLYILSFHNAWDFPGTDLPLSQQLGRLITNGRSFLLNPNLLLFTVIAILQWINLARPQRTDRWRLSQTDALVLLVLVLLALLGFWHWSINPILELATLLINAVFFVMATRFLREGLAEGQRSLFWSGLILLTLQILSRTLEYDTGLLVKSLAFLLCGIGIIAIGLWFERYVRTLRNSEFGVRNS
ncbi:DUF2157 domain-containing protein [Leptolyngbya sp. FACHB-711]|uniref:DUF2157 domain-containing protein n=1 Tax=Leptolyngbya sp. FACHB-711 TaxID=2692813 RepID=UPI0018F0075A|nr:DUF2157 domain-containing protein [Leptolyngbya sp. FACHB-711]